MNIGHIFKAALFSAALVGLAACGTTAVAIPVPITSAVAGAQVTTPSEAPVADNESTDPSAASEVGKPGVWARFSGGIQTTITTPVAFKPSDTASGTDTFKSFVEFTVKVRNTGTASYDPTLYTTSVSSGGVEAVQVIDIMVGLGLPPQTAVLPGKTIEFKVAYGVKDPADLTVQLSPGFQYDSVTFTAGVK